MSVRADDIRVPPLTAVMVREGAAHYRVMFQSCPGAPGHEPEDVGQGLTPERPDLQQAVPRWTAAEFYWIVKHGIEMTGMPSWGESHDEQDFWKLSALLQRLPDMPDDTYRELSGGGHHAGAPVRAFEGEE